MKRRLREGVEFFHFLRSRQDRGLKRLIVTADDFGAAREVNEAVEARPPRRRSDRGEPHGVGAGGGRCDRPRAAHAFPARRTASGTGGRAADAAGARQCPIWWMPAADFRTDMGGARRGHRLPAARRGASSPPRSPRSSRPSATAASTLDHVNAHQHFHLHPAGRPLLIVIGARFGCARVRVPLEPAGVLRSVEPARLPMRRARSRCPSRWRCAGACAPPASPHADRLFGLRWSGAHDARRALRGSSAHLPRRT